MISNDNIQCLLQDLLINNLQMSCYNCAKNYDFYTSNPKTKTSIFGISCFASLICSIILLQSGQNWFKENSSQWFLAWKIVGLIKDEMLWTTQWGKEKQTYMTDKHWEKNWSNCDTDYVRTTGFLWRPPKWRIDMTQRKTPGLWQRMLMASSVWWTLAVTMKGCTFSCAQWW